MSLIEGRYTTEVSTGAEFLASENGARVIAEQRATALQGFRGTHEYLAAKSKALEFYIDTVHLCHEPFVARGVSEEIAYAVESHIPPRAKADDDEDGGDEEGDEQEMIDALSDGSQHLD